MQQFWDIFWQNIAWILTVIGGAIGSAWMWACRIKNRSHKNTRLIKEVDKKVDDSIEKGWGRLDNLEEMIKTNEEQNAKEHESMTKRIDDLRDHMDGRFDKIMELLVNKGDKQ